MTWDEIEALPIGAVVMCRPQVFQRSTHGWQEPGNHKAWRSDQITACGFVELLWKPHE